MQDKGSLGTNGNRRSLSVCGNVYEAPIPCDTFATFCGQAYKRDKTGGNKEEERCRRSPQPTPCGYHFSSSPLEPLKSSCTRRYVTVAQADSMVRALAGKKRKLHP